MPMVRSSDYPEPITMNVAHYQGMQISPGKQQPVEDALVMEYALEIHINSAPFSITMITPGMEKELIRGLLHSEDVFRGDDAAIQIELRETGDSHLHAEVSIDAEALGQGFLNGRSLLSVASCGICGKKELDFLHLQAIETDRTVPHALIPELFRIMSSQQHAWSITGGSHAAAAFSLQGNLLALAEDIGRHNAVDKVIGKLLMTESLSRADLLLVSSRVSYEIVAKCFTAGIPILAAVSAPSALAVDFCKELGITLIAFCRDERFTVYSHPQRIFGMSSQTVKHDLP